MKFEKFNQKLCSSANSGNSNNARQKKRRLKKFI